MPPVNHGVYPGRFHTQKPELLLLLVKVLWGLVLSPRYSCILIYIFHLKLLTVIIYIELGVKMYVYMYEYTDTYIHTHLYVDVYNTYCVYI